MRVCAPEVEFGGSGYCGTVLDHGITGGSAACSESMLGNSREVETGIGNDIVGLNLPCIDSSMPEN